jgi:ABC-type oligopeptide transport system substrate-binding subunit
MKKSKLLIVGLIGLLLAVGMILIGCEKNCEGGCFVSESSMSNEYCRNSSCPHYDQTNPKPVGTKCTC